MAATTLPALLDTGDHASRPAASAVGTGALYSCTDHNLIYQTDGSSWSTWADLARTGMTNPMTTAGDIIYSSDGSGTPARLGVGTNGYALVLASGLPSWVAQLSSIQFVIDGGGAAITTGVKGFVEVPFACTITAVRLLADQSGSIVVDIWKDTYANYPPTDADSITASAVPTISSATKSEDATLTGWTTAIAAGSIIGFNVDSATTVTRVTVALTVYLS